MKHGAFVTVVAVVAGDVVLRSGGALGWVAASLALICVLIALQTAYLRGRSDFYREQR